MIRLLRAFFKVAAQRRYAQYLERSSLCDLCAEGVLQDVEDRLLARPWELGQPDEFGLYPIHYAAMNEHEAAPQILEAILLTNRSCPFCWALHDTVFVSVCLGSEERTAPV